MDWPARKASTSWNIREIKKRENVATGGSENVTLKEGIELYMAKASVKCLNDTIRKLFNPEQEETALTMKNERARMAP